MAMSVDDVRAVARELPRAYEALVYDQVKFRVGRIVFLAFSRDETVMGFGGKVRGPNRIMLPKLALGSATVRGQLTEASEQLAGLWAPVPTVS